MTESTTDRALENLFTRTSANETQIAICLDRTSRHDGEILAMRDKVDEISKEMVTVRSTVESGFAAADRAHIAILESHRGLAESVTQLSNIVTANTNNRRELGAIGRFVLGSIALVSVVAGIAATVVRIAG